MSPPYAQTTDGRLSPTSLYMGSHRWGKLKSTGGIIMYLEPASLMRIVCLGGSIRGKFYFGLRYGCVSARVVGHTLPLPTVSHSGN